MEKRKWLTLEELKARYIAKVLRSVFELQAAAKILDMDASTLYRWRKRLGIVRHQPPPGQGDSSSPN
jgi:transposase-like protein